MIRTLRALFLARSLREMVLLALLAVALDAVWLSRFAARAGRFLRDESSLRLDLQDQARWIASRDAILRSADRAASRLDPSKTLNAIQLYAAVTDMASAAGLDNLRSSGDIPDERSGQFSVHTVRFDISRADWSSLWSFYTALQRRSPYLSIEQCAINADPPNPALLNVSLEVSSVEIARPE